MTTNDDFPITISSLQSAAAARRCAEIMSSSEPWITLGRGYDESLKILRDPSSEVYVAAEATAESELAGFLILQMYGAFKGYIKSLAVAPQARGKGIGSRLMLFAEERVFRDTPNVFVCVSSFNPRARALYERLGYELVGELRDYLIAGHSELLLRKTIAPLNGFRPSPPQNL